MSTPQNPLPTWASLTLASDNECFELPEIPADYPASRLVLVAPARPLICELPQVIGQGREHPGRHHRPIVGDPAPYDRDDLRQYRCDVGPAECAELLR